MGWCLETSSPADAQNPVQNTGLAQSAAAVPALRAVLLLVS